MSRRERLDRGVKGGGGVGRGGEGEGKMEEKKGYFPERQKTVVLSMTLRFFASWGKCASMTRQP